MIEPAPATNRILPLNLTAQAAYDVPGNPPTTRPESAVSNCFPGLEYDHRNLDCRFFPGLEVVYTTDDEEEDEEKKKNKIPTQGIRLLAVALDDAALLHPPAAFEPLLEKLTPQLKALETKLDKPGTWFVSAIEQAGTHIELDDNGKPLDGLVAWRLVRGLRPEQVTLVLEHRPEQKPEEPAAAKPDPETEPEPETTSETGTETTTKPEPIKLVGWRRTYTDPRTGTIDATYQPGELTQSLCSPWTHDFRDCACSYWGSNHPDIVLPAIPHGEPVQPGGAPENPALQIPISWLRDPDFPAVQARALPTQPANRPFDASYFQINSRWQDLGVVLEGRETVGPYVPRSAERDRAEPFANGEELWQRMAELAGLEHLVALFYLYAMFSVRPRDDAAALDPARWPTLGDDVQFTRSVLLEVATSEMQHLRWANHLLWGLSEVLGHDYAPVVQPPATTLPGTDEAAELTPLTPEAVAQFVSLEQSSAYIDGQYARVTATLLQPEYPDHLYQLASNIAQEGEEHFLHFKDLQRLLAGYGKQNPAYLRPVTPGDPSDSDVTAALGTYQSILDLLRTGYQLGDRQNQQALAGARAIMFELQDQAEALAARGVGIPFLAYWRTS